MWIRLRGGPLLSHQYMAVKHKQITALIILGKTKVESVNTLVTLNLAQHTLRVKMTIKFKDFDCATISVAKIVLKSILNDIFSTAYKSS